MTRSAVVQADTALAIPARSMPVTSLSLTPSSRTPAVSTRSTSQPSRTTRVSRRSRVVPGSGDTMLRVYPANALTRLLFPAFTRPASTTRHGRTSRRPTRAARLSRSRAAPASARAPVASRRSIRSHSRCISPASCRATIAAAFRPPMPASASRASHSVSVMSPARSHTGHVCRTTPSRSRLAITASAAASPPWQWISRASAFRRTTTRSSPGPSRQLRHKPNTTAPSGRSKSGPAPRGEKSGETS